MTNINPYAPPQAAIGTVSSEADFQPIKVFSWRGRLGRLRFLAFSSAAYFVYTILTFSVGFIAGALKVSVLFTVVDVVAMVLLIPYSIFFALITIQRSHDMGWSGWMSILALIPVVNLLWLLRPGQYGVNEYGAPPPPNTTRLKIAVFGGAGLVMLVGILAGIFLSMRTFA